LRILRQAEWGQTWIEETRTQLGGVIALAGAGVRIGIARESGKPGIPRRTLGKTGEKVSVLIVGGVAAMKDPPTHSTRRSWRRPH
jgi:hypothetical protein